MSNQVLVRLTGDGGFSFDEEWTGMILPATPKAFGDMYVVHFPVPPSKQDMSGTMTDWIYLASEVDVLLTEYIS